MSGTEEYAGLIGQVVLGRYRVIRLLAIGGMGVIYLARGEGAAGFVRPVTVKRILPAKTSADAVIKGFAREARILSNLRHPGIVAISDFREENGAYLMVLEYVHGFDLGRWLRLVSAKGERFPVDLAIHVTLQMLEALQYAHTLTAPDGTPLNIVHRDVSPSNLLIDVDGHVKLTDFGIARMQASSEEFRTEEGKIRGKFHYLAPELFGRGEPSARTDVFSAGVLLHELLAGLNEFRADDFQTTVARVLGHTLTPLDKLRDDVSPALAAAVARATTKRPEDRFSSAAAFAEALRAARHEDPELVAARFKEAVAADFYDPRMTELVGAEPLRTLEQAWKEPVSTPPPFRAPTPEPRRIAEEAPPLEPTGVASVVEISEISRVVEPIEKPRKTGRSLVLAAGVLVAAGVAVLGPWNKEPEVPTRFVLVEHGEVTPVSDDAVTPPPPAPPLEAPPVAPKEKPVSKPQTAGETLTASFAKQERRVEQCFLEHGKAADREAQISLRFHLATSGIVDRAELQPPELEETALGACLINVAKETRFEPQRKAIVFRIPVMVRRN